ncbi:MAG TPA: tRNA uridine-5-carboxymethylaminomethyl(34) synthesis GTPase MnmE [Candidatus Anaerobutyricum stercoripullorum]|uniref:tRNA modification GTPase MnmE n=1 Tax=Candidatus Anaerobutyricum stercoripullorum TaxID=2838456 RepID=A0A9D1X503_9FIRM|nr:tRNA uridine-5-carboxymethylaminomethyl(34) synthesis GTPase MnmE [Candidatus Anaerobutyricum stercoripullorum]
MINEFDTIAAIATAVSNAGIGIIRISGDDAMRILGEVFEPYNKKKEVSSLESHHVYYGNIKDGDLVVDECIVVIMKGPHSYTREDVVEIDCHGGVSVVYRVLNLVIRAGARPAQPGEFTKRAFLNGRIDLSQAEAVMDLIESRNELARRNSVAQLKGGLSDQIKNIREEVLYQVAYIESALDDPEHISLEGYGQTLYPKAEEWALKTKKMIDTFEDGRYIAEGIRTCIVGKPNAGKSSFLNALLGEERAIVTEIAGTTRDTLEESVTIDGITLNIIDTAGIRDTKDTVERIGVEKARREMENADIILFVADTSSPLTKEDYDILEQIRDKKKMFLLNKSDLSAGFGESDAPDTQCADLKVNEEDKNNSETVAGEIRAYAGEDEPVIAISAKYHQGMDTFIAELKKMMFHGRIDANQEMYITNARHKNALQEAYAGFQCVKESIENGMPEDFFTIDLMNAYEKLGLITGEAVEEDLVNEIFSRFCTGK